MLKVFIGFDHAESVAFHVLCSSIWRHASQPVQIVPLNTSQLKAFHSRPRDPMQSNDFSFTRFLVPFLCGYQGRAVFMDCDMLVTDDIAKLFAFADDGAAVQVVKHNHAPTNDTKYLGNKQTCYAKKNWSSVMLFNNPMCSALTPDVVDEWAGLDLHQFKWLEGDHLIGELPLEWNYLVGYYPHREYSTIQNLHFTEGGPYFNAYRNCEYAAEWWAAFDYMRHCNEGTLQHFSEVAEKVG